MIPKNTRSLFAYLLFILSSVVSSAPLSSLEIPDSTIHKSFLLKPWMPGKPSLVVFKDPSCPYCVRDLKKRSQLNNFNVFLFWAPILGDRSVDHVNIFFKCSTSSSEKVINAVIGRVKPECEGPFNEKLFKLNKGMVEAYNPISVPQYWFGGRQVSFTQLTQLQQKMNSNKEETKSLVKIDWARYQKSAINQILSTRNSIGIVLPEGYSLVEDLLKALSSDNNYNWYVFGIDVTNQSYGNFLCPSYNMTCPDDLKKKLKHNSEEFKLLIGLSNLDKPKFVLDGKELVGSERSSLIPGNILAILTNN